MKTHALLLATLLTTSPVSSQPDERTYLASIEGIVLGEREYVEAFTLDSWDVEFLAICHIPAGWQVRAGRSATPDGILSGEATHGVTFLDRRRLDSLYDLALVRIRGSARGEGSATPNERLPERFSGRAEIGTYGDDAARRIVLTTANVRLEPAEHCPPPR